ncbi:MAG TPA: hypothetical protein DCR93_06545 [Cytophagales bacterium]|nr:hypothetical protein [Cytophagales bacterium]HAP59167.1 hypothetical protein [Cytophagales bacterium]
MENIDLLKRHHGRLLSKSDFFEVFYDTFLESHPDIKQYFMGVEMENQRKLLRHGLNQMVMHADNNFAGTHGLQRIRSTHAPGRLGIPHHLYSHWKASFFAAIKQVDPDYTPQIIAAWENMLDLSIAEIAKSA